MEKYLNSANPLIYTRLLLVTTEEFCWGGRYESGRDHYIPMFVLFCLKQQCKPHFFAFCFRKTTTMTVLFRSKNGRCTCAKKQHPRSLAQAGAPNCPTRLSLSEDIAKLVQSAGASPGHRSCKLFFRRNTLYAGLNLRPPRQAPVAQAAQPP
jgi:hypothetical protein